MKAYVYPADQAGCGHVRLIWASKYLQRLGYPVEIIPPMSTTHIEGDVYSNPGDPNDPHNDTLINIRIPDDADVLVFQRVLLKFIADAIPALRKAGRAVVVDMDDDLTTVDPANVAFLAMHPKHSQDPRRHWVNATRACMDATLVTVSTPKLLQVYAPHGRGVVLRNTVPAEFLEIEHFDSDIVGWGGSLHSHPRDMLPLGSSIAQLTRDGSVDFAVVGPGDGVRKALGLDREPMASGPVEIDAWPYALAQGFGVGIAPLADTEFNRAKSWLKPLEMMALGIPWVASPRAEYRLLHEMHGGKIGFLADRPKDWLRLLRRLVREEGLRQDMSAAGREAVRHHHTMQAHAGDLWGAWESAYRLQRKSAPSVFHR